MLRKLLGEASDGLERVTPRSRGSLCTETTQKKRRCSRPEAPSEKPCSRAGTLTGKPRSRFEMPNEESVWQSSADGTSMPQSSSESLEQIVEGDPRKQLELSVPQNGLGEWKYEFKVSSFTTTILNLLLLTEAEQKVKTRNVRMYISLGSDGSSADKLSLDLKFNIWDTAITFWPKWRSMSKTVFTQYDPFETWYTCQSDAWLDDVKTIYPRSMRCVMVGHTYPPAQEDTALLTESSFSSCAKNMH